jgi:hypothetical protein
VTTEKNGRIECLTTNSCFPKKHNEVNRVYEAFSTLGISEDLKNKVSADDKSKILKFLAKYSMSLLNQELLVNQANLMSNKDELIDLFSFFMPFEKKTKGIVGFFKEFQMQYFLFRDLIKRIVEGKENIGDLKGIFDAHLKHIHPTVDFQTDKNGKKLVPVPNWQIRSLLDWCYFELYVSVLKNEGSKTCKYCGEIFFSNKKNRLCCDSCRFSKTQYKKIWYQKNKPREQKKGKKRMRKRRGKEKKLNKESLGQKN